jgi:hypothetical protein
LDQSISDGNKRRNDETAPQWDKILEESNYKAATDMSSPTREWWKERLRVCRCVCVYQSIVATYHDKRPCRQQGSAVSSKDLLLAILGATSCPPSLAPAACHIICGSTLATRELPTVGIAANFGRWRRFRVRFLVWCLFVFFGDYSRLHP